MCLHALKLFRVAIEEKVRTTASHEVFQMFVDHIHLLNRTSAVTDSANLLLILHIISSHYLLHCYINFSMRFTFMLSEQLSQLTMVHITHDNIAAAHTCLNNSYTVKNDVLY